MVALWTLIALTAVALIYSLRLQQVTRRERYWPVSSPTGPRSFSSTRRQLEVANAALEELAAVDPMTGLSNRRRFDVFLQQEWQRSNRSRPPLSLVMIDHFKQFNDLYGHLAGDECIRRIADVIREAATRVTDLGCR